MAARAGGLAVARGELRVVVDVTAVDDAQGLRVVQIEVRLLNAGRRVDDRDPIVEAREHVEPAVRLVEDEPARATAAHDDVVGGVGNEAVTLELGRAEDPHLARAEGGDVERRAVARDRHSDRRRQAPVPHARRARHLAVVDVLVQMPRENARAVEHGDPRLVEMASDGAGRGRAAGVPGSFEADLVPGLGVGHVDLAARRIDHHVEENRSHAGEGGRLDGRAGRRVDAEHVLVGE